MRPAKVQTCLSIHLVLSEFSLGIFWKVKDAEFLHVGNEDSDETAQTRRLI